MHHNHNDGVLGGYFAKTQLSSWVPTGLQRQLAPGHRHIWMHQTQSQPQNQSQFWHAHCRDCLSQLQLRTTSPACTPQNGCLDNIGHHMHSALDAAVEISEAKCCRCAFTVEARLVPPVVSPGMVADLEMARTAAHRHHPMQGARDLNDTVTMLHRLLRNTVRGETRPIRIANAKLSAALRFDPPCTLILAALGFDLVDGEYRPPSVANSGNSAWLQRACDELSIWAGRTQRRLPDSERSPTYALTPAADSLAATLGAAAYDRQQAGGGTPTLAERDNPEWAFACLGVPADAADTLLVWAYARLAEEDASAEPLDGPQAQRRFDALAAIALARRYPLELQTLVSAESARGMVTPEQVRDACRAVLGDKDACLERVAAADLRSVFTVRMAEAVSMEARCILADHLMVIASAKRDAELRAFAVAARESVMELPSGPPAPLSIDTWAQLPVGLSNIGNTCYLNCMLQCLYSLAPIRSAVLRFGDKATWNEQLLVGRRDGGRVLKLEEIRRAVRLVEMLKELFEKLQQRRVDAWEDSVSGRQVAGGHPLAMASVAVKPARELADMLLMQQQQQQQSEPDGRRVAGQQQQQDVDECMAQCVGLLVHALPPVDTKAEAEGEGDKADESNAETSWIHKLLAGHLETTTTRRAPTQDKPSETTCETFLTLNLNIPPKTLSQTPAADINDCLAALFAPTTIPDPQSNEEITRVSRIADAPPVLCMQVQRVQFNMETMRAFKDNTPLRLRPRLSLTPFASFRGEEGGGVGSKRWELGERVRVMEARLGGLNVMGEEPGARSVVESVEAMRRMAEGVSTWATTQQKQQQQQQQGIIGDLLADLPLPAENIVQSALTIRQQLDAISTTLLHAQSSWTADLLASQRALEEIYDHVPDDQMAYTLHAVFIHSGETPEFGHYWVYLRDCQRGMVRWLKFNDAQVGVVEEEEVLGVVAGVRSDNPYYLVYVRSEDIENMVYMGV